MANARRHSGAVRVASAAGARLGSLAASPSDLAFAGDGLSRRLARAWAESIAIRGYRRTTVRHLIESSGISRRTFYERFGGKEDAFVAIHSEALVSLTTRLEGAVVIQPDWPRRVGAAVVSALRSAACHPCEAQLLVGDPFAAGPRPGYCQEALADRFAPGLALGRREAQGPPLPPGFEVALIGSLAGIFSSRVRSGSAQTLPLLGPSLTEFALAPYLGSAESRRVARSFRSEASWRARHA
jgi:AcrR family transcriptional regulator